MPGERVADVGMEMENFGAGDDSSVTLGDLDFADGAGFETEFHWAAWYDWLGVESMCVHGLGACGIDRGFSAASLVHDFRRVPPAGFAAAQDDIAEERSSRLG